MKAPNPELRMAHVNQNLKAKSPRAVTAVFCGLLAALNLSAFAQTTAFTYQGRLNSGGTPANGSYDLSFALFDAASGGAQQGTALTNAATAVSNGLFTVTLDFGNQFPGADRWLEIGVATNGGGSFTTLSPRQAFTATPYAVRAANAASALSVSGSVSASQLTGTIASNNIAAGSISSVMLAMGAVGSNQLTSGAVTTSAIADGAVTALKVAMATNSILSTTFNNPTPAGTDSFGNSVVAVGNDRVLIGAFLDNTGAGNAGAAYLFSTHGTLLCTFTNPTPSFNDQFGNSVATVGEDRVLIGAYQDNTGETGAGAAYLFGTNGTLLTTFTNPTPAINEWFGFSVAAFGGDRVLIGAIYDNSNTDGAGSAYLFSTNGTLLTTFTNPTPALNDQFGFAVAPVGSDRVLIGAYLDDTGATDAGSAYLFSTNGSLLTTFTNPTPADGDWFGSSVAAVGSDRVLIGSYQDNTGAAKAGAVYLFSANGTLLNTFTNPTPAIRDYFGNSVAAVGSDRILIGAYQDDTGAINAGATYLFSTNGTLLTTFTNPTPAGNGSFGNSVVAVGNDRVLIGAYLDDTGATDAGAAYLFSVATYTPGLVAEGVRKVDDTALSANVSKLGSSIESSEITDWTIVDADISASANITDTKLATISTAGKVADSALSANVSKLGSSIESSEISDGTIVNANISAGANIADTKLATLITSGKVADSALSANVALLNDHQTFTGTNTFTNTFTVTGPFYGSPPYLKFTEEQPKGTAAGGNVAGINVRNFNTNPIDTHNHGSLSGSNIVLNAGTYQCRISAPGYRVDEHQIRLRTTGGTVLLYGTSEFSDDALNPGVQSRSLIEGQFTLATNSTLQVQHHMTLVKTVNGLGLPTSAVWTDGSPVEVYAVAEFWKIK